MKFNLYWRLVGSAKSFWAPNSPNPIECDSLRSALEQLLDSDFIKKAESGLPSGLKIAGLHLCDEDYDWEYRDRL